MLFGSRLALAGRRYERLGELDRRHGRWPSRPTSSAVSAPGPHPTSNHPLTVAHPGKVGELRRKQHRLPAHEAVIRIKSDGEAHGQDLGGLDSREAGLADTLGGG
jgi:hypothetical protein